MRIPHRSGGLLMIESLVVPPVIFNTVSLHIPNTAPDDCGCMRIVLKKSKRIWQISKPKKD